MKIQRECLGSLPLSFMFSLGNLFSRWLCKESALSQTSYCPDYTRYSHELT